MHYTVNFDHHAPHRFVSRKDQNTIRNSWSDDGILESNGTKSGMFKNTL